MSGRGKILVTGADGFIGSHLVERLVIAGRDVRALVLYNSFDSCGWLDSIAETTRSAIEIVAGDIRDAAMVRRAVDGCDAVCHLAALIAIPFSYHAPDAYIQTNITGTLNVLQAARDFGVQRVIQTSTSEVYGTARVVPITEEHPLQGQSPYAATKIGADQLAISFHRSFGTPVCILRPFNTYGPRQSTRAVIPTIITQLLAGQNRVRLGSLHPTRDFSYVADTAAGFEAMLAAENVEGEVVNLGSNFEIAIGELAQLIAEVVGVDIEIESEGMRVRPADSEVERLWADNSKAARLVGWRPRYAGRDGLKRGLAETVTWFRDPANLRLYKPGRYTL